MTVKATVNKGLESQRAAKAVGGNLQAEVTLCTEDTLQAQLTKLGNELRFVLITSAAAPALLSAAPADAMDSEAAGLKLKVVKPTHAECSHCWRHREDVGQHVAHPDLCSRCTENAGGSGEVHRYA